ncbi:MAG: YhfC family intramembrane metalloprotease [Anaerolineales bacterium]|nr:YhfC family intramembrane metalloprotease [Anaerolineales bacterium]
MAVNILYITHPLNGLLMICLAVGLSIVLTRKFRLGWGLWWIGGATFIISQVGHLPFNAWVLNPLVKKIAANEIPPANLTILIALMFGLSAGLFEEISRYIMYRWWAKDARSWKKGILAGAGHGGMEAILLGILVLFTFIQMVAILDADLSTLVAPEELSLVQMQVETYWTSPWYLTLLGAVERAFTLPFHVAASVLVLQSFTRRNLGWLGLAILWHTFVDASVVYLASIWDIYLVEGFIGVLALVNIGIVFLLRRPEPETPPLPGVPAPIEMAVQLAPPEETIENLENSRFQ